MYRYIVTESPGGYEVYVNLISSSAGHYLSRHPYVIRLIKEVIGPMKLTKSRMIIERDMGRIIGNTDIVETKDDDTIFYAQPNKKSVFSRYAKNRNPLPSRKLTIMLQKDSKGNYEVFDTWIGPSTPPFPGDENETAKSKQYWATHALANDSQSIQTKTITKICPY
jgi:hypothetical protein